MRAYIHGCRHTNLLSSESEDNCTRKGWRDGWLLPDPSICPFCSSFTSAVGEILPEKVLLKRSPSIPRSKLVMLGFATAVCHVINNVNTILNPRFHGLNSKTLMKFSAYKSNDNLHDCARF